jgi:hypothetical protein
MLRTAPHASGRVLERCRGSTNVVGVDHRQRHADEPLRIVKYSANQS